MNLKKHQLGLPVHNGNTMVSMLFMIVSEEVSVKDGHIELSNNERVTVFSDRPHRIAKPLPGGVEAFGKFFNDSDFIDDPPNVTFAGNLNADKKEYYTIFEIGDPVLSKNSVLLPIINVIGEEKSIPDGSYSNVSLVVDNIWGTILGSIETAAAGIATAAACTVGEVATMGADTAVCAAGVAGTIALGGNTANSAVNG